MDKKHIIFVSRVLVSAMILIYIGGMFNYFPFIADDLTLRGIEYCTMVICGVAAACTCRILSEINKKS